MVSWKTMIVPLLMVVFAVFVSGATLVDYDNFNGYSTDLIGESNGKWNCTSSGDYPSCVGSFGTGDGYGSFGLNSTLGNKYLNILALDGTNTGGKRTRLTWDMANTSVVGAGDITVQVKYRIKLHGYTIGITGAGMNKGYGGIFEDNLPFGIQLQSASVLGGISSVNPDNFTNLRVEFDSGLNSMLPLNSDCDITGLWQYVDERFYINATRHLTRKETYMNSVLCSNFTVNYQQSASRVILSELLFEMNKAFSIDYDDIYVYEGTVPLGAVSCVTDCDTWELPYYLVESFDGRLDYCDWVTSENTCYDGQLAVEDTTALFYAQKQIDRVEDADTRYVTLKFNATVDSVTTGSSITIRMHDRDNYNFFTVYFRNSGNTLWYNNDGTGTVATNITLGSEFEYMFVIDFVDDTYDIYYNGTKVVTSASLASASFNLHDIDKIKLTSNTATWSMDGLVVYASDENGQPLTPDINIPTQIINDTIICGLYYRVTTTCSEDSDCVTDNCMPNGKCSSFDYNYCDENSMYRGNKCFIAGVAECTLQSTADIILDNFILFLVLLIIIIIVIYMILVTR